MEPLKKAKNFKGPQGPVVLAILDGVGIGTCAAGDVVSRANTPTLDWLAQNALAAKLKAHGTAVGMPSDADRATVRSVTMPSDAAAFLIRVPSW